MSTWVIYAGVAITPEDEISDAAILVEGGRIAAIGSREEIGRPSGADFYDAGTAVAVPGFVDVHVHGAGGHDVMEATPAALDTIAATLARHGTTSFVATTVTASRDALCRSAVGIAKRISASRNRAASRGILAEILGIHFEGPFISKARRGVHPEQWIAAPSVQLLNRLIEAADGAAKILTLAPGIARRFGTRRRSSCRELARLAGPHRRHVRPGRRGDLAGRYARRARFQCDAPIFASRHGRDRRCAHLARSYGGIDR